ncbi:hypothetical protein P9126_16270 [Bacillus glycinifermentans]|uniref:hypothetical protein n=1 Tax=Bacillus glycinifermentans TaxID=1664069 RepID=UPI002DBD46FF|nr:hypothetical protein [Bacillus glycinifermentans]MEC3608536.1 hypothetical protein [Bacillus glycinifermentans]
MSYNYYQLVDKFTKSGFIDKLRQLGWLSLLLMQKLGSCRHKDLKSVQHTFFIGVRLGMVRVTAPECTFPDPAKKNNLGTLSR